MKTRHKRLAIIVTGVVGLTVASLFVLNAFRSNLVFFYSPTEVLGGKVAVNKTIRIGGLVEKGSVQRSPDGLKVDFVVTDLNKKLPVHYEGILPDLFREGQGVVAQGAGGRHPDPVFAGHLDPDGDLLVLEVLVDPLLGEPEGRQPAPLGGDQRLVRRGLLGRLLKRREDLGLTQQHWKAGPSRSGPGSSRARRA